MAGYLSDYDATLAQWQAEQGTETLPRQTSRAQCIAAIQHMSPLDIAGQMSCAQQGYSGNAAWPIPQPVSSINVDPSVPSTTNMLSVPENPVNVSNYMPRNAEIVPPSPSVVSEVCQGINDWIAANKGLALAGLLALYFMKGKRK